MREDEGGREGEGEWEREKGSKVEECLKFSARWGSQGQMQLHVFLTAAAIGN